jgi:TDG/mug DNA glycosylase family protein
LVVVFIGINPSPMAATTGHRFAGPSNRFWRVIHLAGFTPVLLRADQDRLLPQYGCGLISALSRPTRRANELSRVELAATGDALRAKIKRHRPKWIAFLGKGAYSAIMARRDVAWGLQEKTLGAARVWVLPDPSGLNRQTLSQLVAAYSALRVAAADDFTAFSANDLDGPESPVQIWGRAASGTNSHLRESLTAAPKGITERVMTSVEKARKDHRPRRITTLFIAESAPVGGTFFYYGNGHLGRYLQRSIEEVLAGGGDFLERFKSYGWYLDELVPAPVDHLTPRERRAAHLGAAQDLQRRIAECRPLAIVCLLSKR